MYTGHVSALGTETCDVGHVICHGDWFRGRSVASDRPWEVGLFS